MTSVAISNSITAIGEYAFYSCSNLLNVYYSGSRDDWNNIRIDTDNNPLEDAIIHYNSAEAKSRSADSGFTELETTPPAEEELAPQNAEDLTEEGDFIPEEADNAILEESQPEEGNSVEIPAA